MGTNTENSAHFNASQSTGKRNPQNNDLIKNLADYCLVMSFADELLKREILTQEEYDGFSVETAQYCALKKAKNPCNPRADKDFHSRHNNSGSNLVDHGGD